jgi:hypothetical protein
MADDREPYGRLVRETWVNWAREQYRAKPSWITDWDELDDGQREVDMRIGSAVAAQAVHDAGVDVDVMRMRLTVLAAHFPVLRRALVIAVEDSETEREAREYRAALEALGGAEKEEQP